MKVICMLRGRLYHENRHEKVCVCTRVFVYVDACVCARVHSCVYFCELYMCAFVDKLHSLNFQSYPLISPSMFSVQATTLLKESWQKKTEKQRRRRRRGCC